MTGFSPRNIVVSIKGTSSQFIWGNSMICPSEHSVETQTPSAHIQAPANSLPAPDVGGMSAGGLWPEGRGWWYSQLGRVPPRSPLSSPSHSSGVPLSSGPPSSGPQQQSSKSSLRAGPHAAFLALRGGPLRKGRSAWKWAREGDKEGEQRTAGWEEALFVSLSASKGNFGFVGGEEQLSRQELLYHQGRRCSCFVSRALWKLPGQQGT